MRKRHVLFVTGMALVCLFAFSTAVLADALTFEITPKAKLLKVTMYSKEVIKASSENLVLFDVTIKNTDKVPNLYSVSVVIPDEGGAEDFIPVEGEQKLAPGKEGTTSVGVVSPKFPPTGYMIKIDVIEER